MQAGRLNQRVTIEAPPTAQDTDGQPTGGWVTVATVWADIRHQSGLEAVKAGAVASTVKASIRIRYRTGILSGMRLLHGATAYNILAVLPDLAGKQHVDLVCEVVS
jgi:SPP1 family predicted phage head-tail adaptor